MTRSHRSSGGPTKKIFTIDESGLQEVFSAKKGFKPGAIAVDTQGRAFICDESNSEIHLLELDESAAEKECAKGRKMTKDYVPGMVITAKLRLQQGAFKQAYDDLKPLADRRSNDPVIGLLRSITDPLLAPIRRNVPPLGGIDLSPLVALIALQLAKMLLLPPLLHLA